MPLYKMSFDKHGVIDVHKEMLFLDRIYVKFLSWPGAENKLYFWLEDRLIYKWLLRNRISIQRMTDIVTLHGFLSHYMYM